MPELLDRLRDALADRYRIVREIGRGGMAVVFLAEDLRHQRSVALKALNPEVASAIGPQRFLQEVGIAARLTHPHILPLHDSGQADGLLYYVMPYAPGESLRDCLNREKQLAVEEAVRIVREVAGALDYAHRQGVVHRDIKPENILLAEGQAVVSDFGIARAVHESGEAGLTTTGVSLGTPTYMSPEQALGRGAVDGRSDQYSLACVLYELLAGQPPFTGSTGESIVHQHLSVSPRPVTELRPAVPAAVAMALARGLAKTPADRFATAFHFAEALIVATPGKAAAETLHAAPPERYRMAPRAAVTALVCLVVLGGASLHPRVREFVLGTFRAPLGPPSLAVLHFENFGESRADDYLAAGVTEEVITSLSRIGGLRVASRTAIEQYRGRHVSPQQLGRELKVGYVLEGSIQRTGDDLRVTAQLIKTDDGFHTWADKWQGKMEDIFAVQDTIASRIASALRVTLTPEERARISRRWTANAQAYAYYLAGREIYWDYSRPQPGTDSRPWFEKALELDPQYSPALAGLADALLAATEWQKPRSFITAIELARRAERIDPSLALAWKAEGRAHREKGDFKRAVTILKHAIEVDPQESESYAALATAYAAMGKRDLALRMVRRAIALEPDREQPNSYAFLADLYREWGLYENADRAVAEGLARIPRSPSLLIASAKNLSAQGRYPEAISRLRSVIMDRPDYFGAHLSLGNILNRARRFDEADSVFRSMAARWPESIRALNEVAFHELDRGRYPAAESLLTGILRREPYYFAYLNLAQCYRRTGRAAAAESLYVYVAKRWPNDARPCEGIARFYWGLERFREAERWARKAIQFSPESESAHSQLAWDYYAQGEYDKAAETFRRAIALRPDAYWDYEHLSQVLVSKGQLPDALAAAQRSVELKPDYLDGINMVGLAYNRMGNYHQAAAAYERILAADSTHTTALNNLAFIYRREERFQKALEMYQRAAELDTSAGAWWPNMAWLAFADLHDFDLARRAAERCTARARGTFFAGRGYEILGLIEEGEGRREVARGIYSRGVAEMQGVLRVDPNDDRVHNTVGRLWARMGDVTKARQQARWIVEAQGSSPAVLYKAAAIMAVAGETDGAFEYLKRAVAAGYVDKAEMKRDPDLDKLRGDRRFNEVLATVR